MQFYSLSPPLREGLEHNYSLRFHFEPLGIALAGGNDGFDKGHAADTVVDVGEIQLQFGGLASQNLRPHRIGEVTIGISKRL